MAYHKFLLSAGLAQVADTKQCIEPLCGHGSDKSTEHGTCGGAVSETAAFIAVTSLEVLRN